MEVCAAIKGTGERFYKDSRCIIDALCCKGINIKETSLESMGVNQVVLEFREDAGALVTLASSDGSERIDSLRLTGKQPEKDVLYEVIARLYVRGINPDWVNLYPDGSKRMVNVPPYSFEKNHVWIKPEPEVG